jgi:hypothetical protein
VRVTQALQGHKVLRGKLVSLVTQENLVHQDFLAHPVTQENLAHLAHPVMRANLAHLAHPVMRVQTALMERRA